MAEKPEVNKSQAIRDHFKSNPKAKTQEVVDALAKQASRSLSALSAPSSPSTTRGTLPRKRPRQRPRQRRQARPRRTA